MDIFATAVRAAPDPAILERLAHEAAAGRHRVPIARTYGIEELPTALAGYAAGTLGRVAIARCANRRRA
jgi:hypothetical protein